MSRTNLALAALAAASVAAIAPSVAAAQAPAAFTETAAAAPAESTDDTSWTVQLGGTLNMGNTRSFQLAGGTNFMVRRDIHLFQMDFSFTYGLAALRDANGVWSDFDAIAQNINGKIRYDLFVDPDWSIFAVATGRNDPFAGLDFRFQGQLGVSRSLLRESEGEHRLWVELGADITQARQLMSDAGLLNTGRVESLVNAQGQHAANTPAIKRASMHRKLRIGLLVIVVALAGVHALRLALA